MPLRPVFIACLCLLLSTAFCQEPTAREVAKKTLEVYDQLNSLQIQSVSRNLKLVRAPEANTLAGTSPYTVTPPTYLQFSAMIHRPNDWSIAQRTATTNAGGSVVWARDFVSVFKWTGHESVVGKGEGTSFKTVRLDELGLKRKIRAMLGLPFPRDYLLSQYVPLIQGYGEPPLFKINNAVWATIENGDPSSYCIKGRTYSGHTILAWIDKKTFEARRSIIWADQPLRKPESETGPPGRFPYEFIHFQEFYYRLQAVNPKFNDGTMQLLSPDRVVPPKMEDYEWTTPEGLMSLFETEG